MSIQMRGAEVAKAMKEKLIREREELNAAGVIHALRSFG